MIIKNMISTFSILIFIILIPLLAGILFPFAILDPLFYILIGLILIILSIFIIFYLFEFK
jgi:hypothetical protein